MGYGVVGCARWSVALAGLALLGLAACAGDSEDAGEAAAASIEVGDVGFMTPESVLADTVADVYLVSNINGSPTDKDGNGFISRVSPDGTVQELRWIDGTNAMVELNAPKGMAIRGDTLFVADIDCIRVFNRVTGAAVSRICVDGATFLNDVAVGPEGSLFVTDTGVRFGADGAMESTGSAAVYRLSLEEGRQHTTLARGDDLGGPNGIAVGRRGIFVASWNGGLYALTPAGARTQLVPPGPRQLDGIVFTPDGGFLYSSWADSTVYHVDPDGQLDELMTGVEAPADIGYDPRRNRVLVPLFMQNRLVFRDVT